MEIYPDDILLQFEFDRIREKVETHCCSASSKALAFAITPDGDFEIVTIALRQVNEFLQTLLNRGHFPDTQFEEFAGEADLLKIQGSVLNEQQFSRIRSATILCNHLAKFLRERQSAFPFIYQLSTTISEHPEICQAIDAMIDQHSIVMDRASQELFEIRSRLLSSKREADRRFRAYLNEFRKKGWLREHEESYYHNRRVLAVPSEYRKEVRGLVHGKSESGKTFLVEPEELVELNNIVAELEEDERMEVRRLLRELSDQLRPFADAILSYHYFLTCIDLIRAKAMFAREVNAILPEISKNPQLHLVEAIHPLLFLRNRARNQEVIPQNIDLNNEQRIIIISGPNAGGKSITLKTVGLLQLMFQSGLLIPAKEGSRMGFFKNLLTDIGDSQSIEFALSTYSSRLIRMNYFLRNAGPASLVLIDEFGTGTDPELGGAIAEALLEELNRSKVFGVFTTHYTNIKLLADRLPGVVNASMLFDPATLQPRFKLLVGQPGSSYAFEVAERIGFPASVLNNARSKVQSEKIKLNQMLGDLHRQKNEQEEKLKQLKNKESRADAASLRFDQMREKLEAKLEVEREKSEQLRQFADWGRKMKSLMDEWAKTKDRKSVIKKFIGAITVEQKKRAAENAPEKLEKKRQALIEQRKKEIKTGSLVRMMNGKQTGTVEEIRKEIVYVNFGNMKAKVAIENLEPAVEKDQKSKKQSD